MTEHTVKPNQVYRSKNKRSRIKVRNSKSHDDSALFAILFEVDSYPISNQSLGPGEERFYIPQTAEIGGHRAPPAGVVSVSNLGPVSLKVTTY